MAYVDGFVLVISEKNVEAYKKVARDAGKIWMKYGALDYKECIGDDVRPKGIELTFPKLVGLKKGEKVFFSYILYKSRKHRGQVNGKVMKDPFMNQDTPMPFDMKRMSFGGFEVVVDVKPAPKKK